MTHLYGKKRLYTQDSYCGEVKLVGMKCRVKCLFPFSLHLVTALTCPAKLQPSRPAAIRISLVLLVQSPKDKFHSAMASSAVMLLRFTAPHSEFSVRSC